MTALKEAERDVVLAQEGLKPLKQRVFRAGGWTLIGHFLTLALRLLSSIILTRIFSPDVFGVLAIITALNTLIGLLTDIGLRQAVVQSHHGSSPRFLQTAFSVQALRGLALWALCALAAGGLVAGRWVGLLPADSVYAQPLLPELLIVGSLSSVILGFQSIKTYTATRDLSLGRLTLIEVVSFLSGLVVIVGLGILTKSIWSYIAGLLLTSAIAVFLGHTWLRGPKDGFAWDRDAIRELSRFGRWIFLSSAVSATILNGDRMVLAALLTPTELGFYSIASSLANVPDALASKLFGSVAMPTLSEVNRRQPERLGQLFSRMRWFSDSFMLFVAGFLFATAIPIVQLLYDPRYAEAGWMLKWLSFGLVFARYNIVGSAYLALGKPQFLSAIAAVRSISLFVFLAVGFWSTGVAGAIIGMALHMIPSTVCMLYFAWRLGIADVRLEAVILPVWVAGWCAGGGVNALIHILR